MIGDSVLLSHGSGNNYSNLEWTVFFSKCIIKVETLLLGTTVRLLLSLLTLPKVKIEKKIFTRFKYSGAVWTITCYVVNS
jgi:hypothetical protein